MGNRKEKNMDSEKLWSEFTRKYNIECDKFDVWAFGDNGEMLTNLVIKEIKTATSSLYILYENEPLPEAGTYSVIVDNNGNAKCVIKTTKIEIVPFNEVTEEHAYQEGESDRKLETWRKIHKTFFEKCLEKKEMTFDENMLVVCEQFELVYAK